MDISLFQGFTKHKQNQKTLDVLKEIEDELYSKTINRLRLALRKGETETAGRTKKQLPPVTFSATYAEKRLAQHITGYNDIIVLDFDKLTPEALLHCRTAIEQEAQTLFCFRSPSGDGLKVGVYLATPAATKLREQTLHNKKEIGFSALESYHKTQFTHALKYYEELTNTEIDTSGSDIGRLCFLSSDPEIYINKAALQALPQVTTRIVPAPAIPKRSSQSKLIQTLLPGDPTRSCEHLPAHTRATFASCITSTRRSHTFEPGDRDSFLFSLSNKCYRKKLPLEEVEQLVLQQFHADDMDVLIPVRKAYIHTSKSDAQEEEKKKPIAQRVMEFADQHYQVRYNIVRCCVEYRENNPTAEWRLMDAREYNSIFVELNRAGINCAAHVVRSIINSSYAKEYNPFEDYFQNLPQWDETTDHIATLAATVTTSSQEFWENCLRRWLVAMVACALEERVVNQLALVLQGEQGKGKSTWIRNLLPPQLATYYRNGMLNPDNKDHALYLTDCLIINLDDFEGLRKGKIEELKRMITQESVNERRAFAADSRLYIRRASIIASTNESNFLQDRTGTRRFPTVTALKIDYTTPINHAGIYAQAFALWKKGFHYWYNQEETIQLNAQNEIYTITPPEEELFYVHYTKPQVCNDYDSHWLPASAILTRLTMLGKLFVTPQSQQIVSALLERNGFEKQKSPQGITEYFVKIRREKVTC
ncbi:hypothetical protein D0T50_06910 [Bacteroides sp. 214]|uniref:VapE domain-containing protein n=1 Tax=Bacteroides sp. 214 TaxID=2302935 RepID=UPI0013D7243D|nr:VapE domain-containing protein [Bacteroides sp. 214]NDW12618.1 hypothetical protein [Bacteroides sp. 214]